MAAKLTLFVGTYTGLGSLGIYTCQMDPTTGALEQLAVTSGIAEPSFLALDPTGDHLYAVSETADVAAKLKPHTGLPHTCGSPPACRQLSATVAGRIFRLGLGPSASDPTDINKLVPA